MRIQRDLGSKLFDGIGSALVLPSLFVGLLFLQKPFFQILGRPGLLAYGVVLMAISIFCLDRAVHPRFSGTRQAWNGMIGGLLTWLVTYLAMQIGDRTLSGLTAAVIFLLVGLITLVLWRRIPQVGLRFYCLTFVANYLIFLIMIGVKNWTLRLGFLSEIWRITGFLCIPAMVITVGWMLYYSEKRMQRLWLGACLSFFVILAVSVFWGEIIYAFV